MTMPLLSPAALTSLRGLLGGAYPDTCTVQRRTPTDDGSGGETVAWTTVPLGQTVACRLVPKPRLALARPLGGVESKESYLDIVFPTGTDVQAADHVAVLGITVEVRDAAPRSWEVANRVSGVVLQ